MAEKTALIFPGPGSHQPGLLEPFSRAGAKARDDLAVIDKVAASYGWGPVSKGLTDTSARTDTPELLWLGFYASSLALYHVATEAGLRADVLVGHSGGEFTALVVAGSLSVEDGARVLAERAEALRRSAPAAGAMLVLSAAARRAEALCSAVADPSLALAVDNGPRQSVVSGHSGPIELLDRLARELGWRTTRLAMPFLMHNPVLAAATEELLDAVSDVPVRAPKLPLHSPLLGRPVLSAADARSVIAGHLVRPVVFGPALEYLHRSGYGRFVECGARRILTDLVLDGLPKGVEADTVLGWASAAAEDPTIPASRGATVPEKPTGVPDAGAQTPPAPSAEASGGQQAVLPEDDAQLLAELRRVYAEVLQYPEEVFEKDTDLEGDLGVSSIKQTEIFARLLDNYDLPTPSSDTRVSAHRTLGEISGLLRNLNT
ncbi:acyltransferase domain-containing protein [Streptomyces griseus]|uniref:acyltransferase domain-containing protein n=1 Tax=Streptomyces griseus TaxID=1911 RepID=UPI0004C67805|nr:acyltransferase domain-containing protein [Streptomyces griseus]